ncbi:PKD domain-containing protein [Xanthovirga aplysinae]|uniref:PKD domain-containing protein n=1 Tax=Xanthovirga aplysinae TaxID=2529853 RepID=UPI0012BBC971|nr:PKD domain-containing protein [Xanthovirga aplysinae]MTI31896.1 PKD domain-containing protein [Xanthovirga aplysinae]
MAQNKKRIENDPSTQKTFNDNSSKRIPSNFSGYIYQTFLFFFLISAVVFFLKKKDHVNCEDVLNYIKSDNYTVGSLIQFQDESYGAKSWEWDFGDGSSKVRKAHALHSFKEAGQYTVTLIINGNCKTEHVLNIEEKKPVLDSTLLPVFTLPKSVQVGKAVTFKDNTPHASSWQWDFGDGTTINSTLKDPSHTYSSPGIKTVSLMVNNDHHNITQQKIVVTPRKSIRKKIEVHKNKAPSQLKALENHNPEESQGPLEDIRKEALLVPRSQKSDELRLTPEISDKEFEQKLFQIASGRKTKEDLLEQLCGNLDIPVVKNDKELISFSELCDDIKGKKIKINALEIRRNQLRCISGISISYKKKWF